LPISRIWAASRRFQATPLKVDLKQFSTLAAAAGISWKPGSSGSVSARMARPPSAATRALSLAGLKVDVVPIIGTYVMVGKKRAHVVRHLDNGIGVEFVKTPESSGSLFDS
jgi:hypothetical protein